MVRVLCIFLSVIFALVPNFSRGSNSDDSLNKVSLQLHWKHQYEFAGYYIAKEKGFYQQEGLDVQIYEYNPVDNKSSYQALISGTRDFATDDVSNLSPKQKDDLPIVMLSNYFKRSALAIITQPKILLPSELNGQRLMAAPFDINGVSISSLFKKFKIAPSDVEIIPHSFNIDAFSKGDVHAMTVFQTNQIYELRKKNIDYNLIDPGSYGVEIYGDSLFTSEKMANESPEIVKSFKKASDKGWAYALENPDEAIQIILNKYNTQNKSLDELKFEAFETQRFILSKVYAVGHIDLNKVKEFEKSFSALGREIIFKAFSEYIDNSPDLAANSSAKKVVKIQFDWKHQFQFAGFYAAKEKGFYSEYGLDVEFVEYRSGLNILDALIDRTVDFGVLNSEAITSRLNGSPIVLLSNYFKRSPYVIVSNENIVSPADLKNKKVMTGKDTFYDSGLGIMFKQFGLRENDVIIVPQSFNVEDFITGKVDAVTVYLTDQMFEIDKSKKKYNILDANNFGVEDYASTLVTSENMIKTHPDIVKNFKIASDRGWKYALSNPEEMIELIKEKYNTLNKSEEALVFESEQIKKVFQAEHYPIGSIDMHKLRRMGEMLIQLGKASSLEKLSGFIYDDELNHIDALEGIKFSPEEMLWKKEKEVIKVSSEMDNVPFDYRLFGESKGYSIELLKLITNRLGMKLKVIPLPDGVSQNDSHAKGEIDLVHSAQHYSIESNSAIISNSYLAAKTVFVIRKDVNEITQLSELDGRGVAVLDGSAYQRYLKKYHPNLKTWVGRTKQQLLEAVNAGVAYGMIDTDISAQYLLKTYGMNELKISSRVTDFNNSQGSDFHFYNENDDKIMISVINKALKLITNEELHSIRGGWQSGNDNKQADQQKILLTFNELRYLENKGNITMCVMPNWPPFGWINKDGKHEGVSADLIQLIQQRLNVKFVLYPTKSWIESVEMLRTRKCDILPLATDLAELRDSMLFTTPHMKSSLVIATKSDEIFLKDSSEIGQRKVGILVGSAFTESLRLLRPEIQIVKVNSVKEGLEKVREGELWGYIDAMPVIAYMLQEHSMLDLKIVGKLEFDLENAIASRSDEPILNQIMQQGLDSISEEERRAINSRWVTVRFEQDFDHVLFLQVVFAGVVIIVIVFVWNRRLARLNKILDKTQVILSNTSSELQTIFDHAFVGIFITNGNLEIERMNKFAECTLFKCQIGHYIGRSMRNLFVDGADYEDFKRTTKDNNTTSLKIEAPFVRDPGQQFLAKAVGSYVEADSQQRVIWLITDITEKRLQEQKLAQTFKELEIILHNVGVGIVYVKQEEILRINKAFTDMLGYEQDAIIGQSIELYQCQETALTKQLVRREHQASLRYDSLLMRSDGTKLLCENVMSLVNPQDPSLGEIWLHRDITELWRAQNELQAARDEALAQKIVAEKTLVQVASLLNNSGQGFLSFGPQLTIAVGCSQECVRIFKQEIEGSFVPDLLFKHDVKKKEFLIKILPLIIDSKSDELKRDAYISLLPQEYKIRQRQYRAEYRVINNEQMMIVLTDITDQKILQEKLAIERSRLEFIVNALENRNELLAILHDFELFRSKTLPDLLTFEQSAMTVLLEVMRPIHTFKSLFAQANLPKMPGLLHELESRLDALKNHTEQLDITQIKQVLGSVNLTETLDSDLNLLREKLGSDYFRSELTMQVPIPLIKALETEAKTIYGEKSRIVDLIQQLRFVPIEDLFSSHFKLAAQLAERQHKKLEPICLKGEPVLVDPDIYGSFCKSLVHVFRNAVDHGLEDMDTRLLLDKPEASTIQCHAHVTNGRLVLVIEDDGKGIDVDALKLKALSLGYISMSEYNNFDIKMVYRLLFSEGLSTKQNVTDISGRGIGLNAVLSELAELDGDVRVHTEFGKGTRFEFSLPYKPLTFTTEINAERQRAREYLAAMPKICDSVMGSQLNLVLQLDQNIRDCTPDNLYEFTSLVVVGTGVDIKIGLSMERPLLLEVTRLFEPMFTPEEVLQLADSVGDEIVNALVGKLMVYFTHLSSRVTMSTPQRVRPEDYVLINDGRMLYGMEGNTEFGKFLIFCLLPMEGGGHEKAVFDC